MAREARSELVSIDANPIPEGAQVEILNASDEVRIRAARWMSRRERGLGTVCLFQGRAEFIEKYAETVQDLLDRGFGVATLDWRGQGGSSRLASRPLRGHVGDFSHYQRDLDVFMRDFVLPGCRPPYYVLAHSMGGAIALMGARRRQTWFDRMVLTAPLLGLPGIFGSGLARTAASLMAAAGMRTAYVPGLGGDSITAMEPFDANILTSDRDRYVRAARLVAAAPELAIGAPTVGWARAAFRAIEAMADRDFAPAVRTPTLMLMAGSEKVVDNAAIQRLAVRMRTARAVRIHGAHHELLMETDPIRDQVLAAFDAFVPGTQVFAD